MTFRSEAVAPGSGGQVHLPILQTAHCVVAHQRHTERLYSVDLAGFLEMTTDCGSGTGCVAGVHFVPD